MTKIAKLTLLVIFSVMLYAFLLIVFIPQYLYYVLNVVYDVAGDVIEKVLNDDKDTSDN